MIGNREAGQIAIGVGRGGELDPHIVEKQGKVRRAGAEAIDVDRGEATLAGVAAKSCLQRAIVENIGDRREGRGATSTRRQFATTQTTDREHHETKERKAQEI